MTTTQARFVKFGIVGGSGVAVNMGILYLLTELVRFDYRLSSLAAIELAIINNFAWNSFWTWCDRKAGGLYPLFKRLVKFNVSAAVVALIINWGLLIVLTEIAGLYYQLSNLIGIACGTIVNFLISHFWVFARTMEGDYHGPTTAP